MHTEGTAQGKIILCGEYAVVFGHQGIAVPARQALHVTWNASGDARIPIVEWQGITGDARWDAYVRDLMDRLGTMAGKPLSGTLRIENTLPLGKGMGSSTALVIALARCLLGADSRKEAAAVEAAVNPRGSGMDFAVIWEEKPLLFQRGQAAKVIALPADLGEDAVLIDTGAPKETTAELVAWISEKHSRGDATTVQAIRTIGACAERICVGEPLQDVMRDHHRAQVALGTVSASAQHMIQDIEQAGGVAKVIGAGGRSGGSGMVLALGCDRTSMERIASRYGFSVVASH